MLWVVLKVSVLPVLALVTAPKLPEIFQCVGLPNFVGTFRLMCWQVHCHSYSALIPK